MGPLRAGRVPAGARGYYTVHRRCIRVLEALHGTGPAQRERCRRKGAGVQRRKPRGELYSRTSATSTKNLVGSSVRTPCLLWYLRSGVAPAAAVLSVLSAPSRSFAPPRPRPVAPLLPPCGSAATLPPRSLCCSAPSYRFRPPAPPPSQPSPPSAICVGATACGVGCTARRGTARRGSR